MKSKLIENKISVYIYSFLALSILFSACKTNNTENKANNDKRVYQNHVVKIDQMKFVPDTVIVKKGDTITFVNADLVAHNATQLPDATWKSPDLQQFDSWSFVPEKSDSFYCSLHLVMKGQIVVE